MLSRNLPKLPVALDPIPTNLLLDILPVLASVLTAVVNGVLSKSVLPSDLKAAAIHPLLKKSGLNSEMLKHFRPVSNLFFISRVIERVVAARLLEHMNEKSRLDPMQSAHRASHSTKTALLRFHNDIVDTVDKGKGVCLVLVDLSAAFDTVDHKILLDLLKDYVGLDGPVL